VRNQSLKVEGAAPQGTETTLHKSWFYFAHSLTFQSCLMSCHDLPPTHYLSGRPPKCLIVRTHITLAALTIITLFSENLKFPKNKELISIFLLKFFFEEKY